MKERKPPKPAVKNAPLVSIPLALRNRINALEHALLTGNRHDRRNARKKFAALVSTSPILRNRINDLGRELEAGRITPQQYDRRYAQLLDIMLPGPSTSSRFGRLGRNPAAIPRHSVSGGLPSLGKVR